jgi:hypothetical protein
VPVGLACFAEWSYFVDGFRVFDITTDAATNGLLSGRDQLAISFILVELEKTSVSTNI